MENVTIRNFSNNRTFLDQIYGFRSSIVHRNGDF
jgi:hypothetical protein